MLFQGTELKIGGGVLIVIYPRKPRCQLQCVIWQETPITRVLRWAKYIRAKLGLRMRVRRLFSRKKGVARRLGDPSRFPVGVWVRVLEEPAIRETLDGKGKRRGLAWMPQLWPYCGTVHEVLKPVRRMMDDKGKMRPISRTVLLATVPCGGVAGASGCGRQCPMMFRDEWLEVAEAPATKAAFQGKEMDMFAEVRSAEELKGGRVGGNRHGGLLFMPEMLEYAGKRFRVVKKVERAWDGTGYRRVAEPIYLLEGLHCSGDVLGDEGPCDRGCRILWHKDWLRLESEEM